MSFPFVGNVVNARYSDPELNTVALTYSDGDKVISYSMTTEADDPRWVALQEDIGIEEVDRMTLEFNEAHRQEFRLAFEDYASRNELVWVAEMDIYNLVAKLLVFDPDDESHTEALFKIKLAIFDSEVVKTSGNTELKTEVRRSETPLEALAAFAKIQAEDGTP